MNKLAEEIGQLKEKRDAIILAHNYERAEIQDIADFIGDSLALSRKAASNDAKVVVFCGVDFMAETANILSPQKTVLIPDRSAICPMALMLSAAQVRAAKKTFPDAKTVLYINTTAEAKAEADCICTSANAVEIVDAMGSETVLFGPDKNLAYYVSKRSKKKVVPITDYGVCPTHHQLSKEDFLAAKRMHPEAKIVVHPEAIPAVQDLADSIASTEGMIGYCRNSEAKEFIIGTESGMIFRLQKEIPEKKFYPVCDLAVCPPMKMTTLEKVRDALRDMKYPVNVPEETAKEARKAIENMLRLSK